MAESKKVKTKVIDSCCAVSMGDYKPRLYLELEGKDVSQIKGLKVGEEGCFMVTGKIVGLEQRDRTDLDGKSKKTGSIQIEGFEVEVLGEETNEYTAMAKDED